MNIPHPAPTSPHMYWYSIWDLDNCLSDDKWRSPLIDWHLDGNERYNRYDAQMRKDGAAHVAEWRVITSMSTPVFITGRRERWRELTRDWICERLPMLRNQRLVWQHDPLVLMRPNDCNDKPVTLKRRLLEELERRHGIDPGRVIAAFDDVSSIVDMYLEHGIPATVLRCHDPRDTYNSNDL